MAVVHAETDANCDGEVDSRHMSWQLGEGVQLERQKGSPDHSSGAPLRRGRQGSTGCGRHVPASGRGQRATRPVARFLQLQSIQKAACSEGSPSE